MMGSDKYSITFKLYIFGWGWWKYARQCYCSCLIVGYKRSAIGMGRLLLIRGASARSNRGFAMHGLVGYCTSGSPLVATEPLLNVLTRGLY